MAKPDARLPRDQEQCPDQFVDETAQFWAERTGDKVSPEDARRITENLAGFFKVLARWSGADSRTQAGQGTCGPYEESGGSKA